MDPDLQAPVQHELLLTLCNVRFQLMRLNAILFFQVQWAGYVFLVRRHWNNRKLERVKEE
jgi:hypothetical protein